MYSINHLYVGTSRATVAITPNSNKRGDPENLDGLDWVSIVFISAGKLKLKSIRHMFHPCSMFANLKYVPQRDPDKVFGEDRLEY